MWLEILAFVPVVSIAILALVKLSGYFTAHQRNAVASNVGGENGKD